MLILRAGWRSYHGLHNLEYVSVFALKHYQPRPYDGPVLLLRSEERPTGEYRDHQYGWGGLVSALEIHDVPGNHRYVPRAECSGSGGQAPSLPP